ncbi:citrate lyase holo-[acyl-carrier protein] synthase [Desulfosporosinus shakirovi]|uniref:citrate lyase holo-[acyl-carrier protein] synthase n=1 Tax=Desulfosporosinus shakirovi TaxID=2885154 RepID=UPI001E65929F|nr:citrate lyase holo-[acyl-carrier protein] synthase [Desulfosporosinus sp. SRJS8]MCB8815771.1 citrate lyase holo-[acyl-carrier protein] synthase [Desulfosporosinus sp. SRJS8]
MERYTVKDLLEARERRVEFIDSLLKRYQTPILVMRVNYPGLRKTNDLTLTIIQEMSTLICTMLREKVCYKTWQPGAEGPIFLAAVKEEAMALKRITINLEEEHVLGRCLDLDVYDSLGRGISRRELGYPRRKCYVCEEYAQHCVRSRRHGEHEVIEFIEDRFERYRKWGSSNPVDAEKMGKLNVHSREE